MGQTTAFKKNYIKPEVVIMAENRAAGEARYIHRPYGRGSLPSMADTILKIIDMK
jgi:hypothetical protein